MRNQWKKLLGLGVMGMWLGASASAQAASGVGPYYAMPAWDQTLPASTRFIVLTNMNSEAVLDRETGLVWEQSPDTTPPTPRNWHSAQFHCNQKTVGNRKGWRLPTVQELASLVDPSNPGGNPDLPPGHPFSNVQSSVYWSATTDASNTTGAWGVNFLFGGVGDGDKSGAHLAWCVRGGQGPDAQ